MNAIDNIKKIEIQRMLEAGKSARLIERELGIHRNTIGNIKRELEGQSRKLYAKPSKSYLEIPVGPGFCKCGCGEKTSLSESDNKITGKKKGEPNDFIKGHYHNWKRQQNPQWGQQARRQRLRETLRPKLCQAVNEALSFMTLDQIADKFAKEGINRQAVSRMVNYGRSHCSSLYGQVKDIRPRSKSCPLYERPDIPNERETEIPLLNFMRHFVSMDAPLEDDRSRHDMIAADWLTPFEILAEKEEAEEREREQKITRYAERISKSRNGFPYSFV